MSTKVTMLGVSGIAILSHRMRRLQPEVVKALAASIKDIGLLQPIVVRPQPREFGYTLIAGWHRYEAVRNVLRRTEIACLVVDGIDADLIEIAELDENLVRANLSPAEEAAHHAKRKEIYERLHPQTKRGAIGRGRKKSSQNEKSFVDDTAAKTGKGRSTVAREVGRGQIRNIIDAVGTSLDKGDELDALVKLPEAAQQALIERAKAGEKVSAKTEAKTPRVLTPLERILGLLPKLTAEELDEVIAAAQERIKEL
jgi:ParB/RepB/Spo0J family partition protein